MNDSTSGIFLTDIKGYPELEGSLIKSFESEKSFAMVIPGFYYCNDSRQYVTIGYCLNNLINFANKKMSEIDNNFQIIQSLSPELAYMNYLDKKNCGSKENIVSFWIGRTCKISVLQNASQNLGTGIFLNPRIIITNNHLFLNERKVVQRFTARGKVYSKLDKKWIYFEKILTSKGGFDIAFIFLEEEASLNPVPNCNLDDLFIGERLLKKGEKIKTSGHPIFEPGCYDGYSYISEGRIQGFDHYKKLNQVLICYSGYIFSGNSGGPVLTESGELVGLTFCTLKRLNEEVLNEVSLCVNLNSIYKELQNLIIMKNKSISSDNKIFKKMKLINYKANKKLNDLQAFWSPEKDLINFVNL